MNRRSLYYGLLLAGYFAVMALLPVWYGWAARPKLLSPAWVITLLALPLFTALRGLLHGRTYTVKWSLFLALFYFTHGIVEAWSEPAARIYALAEIAAATCWIVAGILYVRRVRAAGFHRENVINR